MQVGTVESIFRYPVKSMAGETLASAPVGERGVPGDRAWAVRDEERGGIRGAKHFPELMRCSARYDSEPPADGSTPATITLPDGRSMSIDAPEAPEALSGVLGGPVTVWPLMPPEMLDHYRRGAPILDDMEAEFRRIFGRTADEPLPDLSVFPEELFEFESPLGTYFDAFPLLLMTTGGLEHMQGLAEDQRFDVRRFRPNVLIDSDSDGGVPEREWVGRKLQVGEATLEITINCLRCSMVTHGFADLPRDTDIMRTLVRETSGELGVYARVVEPGTIRTGDAVSLETA